jgi:hypothetical protein
MKITHTTCNKKLSLELDKIEKTKEKKGAVRKDREREMNKKEKEKEIRNLRHLKQSIRNSCVA